MSNQKIKNYEEIELELEFDFEEAENSLSKQLESSFSELELLEQDRETIGNPEALGKVVLDEVWKQFNNQIGLDITNETLIQKYDREHPEQYQDIKNSIMNDKKYKDANKAMKQKHKEGELKDTYTGKDLGTRDSANLDHVVSRKELYDNKRRKQANLSVKDLANKEENLTPTNEALNKSKGSKSNELYVKQRELREKELKKEYENEIKKIDEANLSDADKRVLKEKKTKMLQDKLDADDYLMMKADKEARKAINHDIRIQAAKEVGKKAGKDALKTMAVSALFALSREIMNGLVRFLKEKAKSFKRFLAEMKESIKSFFAEITSILKNGASTFIGTIISEIFGPIVSTFKKLASLIKQGVSSVIDAVKYLTDKRNSDKPFSVKVAQVGKIITAALAGGSALFLGEIFEKFLLTVPGMQTPIPFIGTLANMIGLFLSSLVSGVIGAIVLNFIDKFIAKKLKENQEQQIIHEKNQVLELQDAQIDLAVHHVDAVKNQMMNDIMTNHASAKEKMEQSLSNIFFKQDEASKPTEIIRSNKEVLNQMQKDLEDLL